MEPLKSQIRIVENFPKDGISFKDIAPLLGDPVAFESIISAFEQRWDTKIDAIAALDARGFVFGSALALRMKVPFVMIRKAGKLPGEVMKISYGLEYGAGALELQKDAFVPNARVLVIDDVLATGGTAEAACLLIEQAEGQVAGCAFLIELAELDGRTKLAAYDVDSLVLY